MLRQRLTFLPFAYFRNPPPLVAVVPLHGAIAAQARMGRGIDLARIEDALDQAFALRGVAAVALSVNSPGGAPVQAALIHDRVRALSAEKNVPVFAFAEDVAASGGYMLLLAGDEIYVHPASLVGSIGVIYMGFGFVEFMQKLGLERRLHTAGEHKAMLDPFLPEKAEDVERLKGIQDDIHQFFIDMVQKRRVGKLTGAASELFSGDVWLGNKAVTLGLADGIGDLRSVMRMKMGPATRFKVIGREKTWIRERLGLGARPSLADGLIDAAEARGLWSRFGL